MTARRICTWSNENTVSAATPSPTVCRQDSSMTGKTSMRPHCVSCAKRPASSQSTKTVAISTMSGNSGSSEGMTDELANIMVMHLRHWQAVERHFDADEHVESAWIPWKQLRDTHITASNSRSPFCMSKFAECGNNSGLQVSNCKNNRRNKRNNEFNSQNVRYLNYANQTWIDVSTRCELRRRRREFRPSSLKWPRKSSFVFSMRKTVRPEGNDGAELLRMA